MSRKSRFRYILFNKPYGVLSQFTDSEGRSTLSDFGPFPNDVYSVGRLDYDSEGLLLLTNDGGLKNFILDPKNMHPRTYLVQVEKVPGEEALENLRKGLVIEKIKTLPAEVRLLTEEPDLPPRPVPIRFRKSIPTAWLEITIREGRNRQVRRMTAAAGYPALRLVRIKIRGLTIESLKPGEMKEIEEKEIEELLK